MTSGTHPPPSTTTAPRPHEALPLGARLQSGHFSIGKVLGRGGFGITYAGNDTHLHRLVAIKEFFPFESERRDGQVQPGELNETEFASLRDKFIAEARLLASFRHVGIVQVYGFFEENNTAYMVMELLQGRTLEQLVDARGALPEAEALSAIANVGAALREVHRAGLIHRDIKPDNVMVCEAPDVATGGEPARVVLIDFGLAKQYEATPHLGTRRLSGTRALGTPGFAPPEQYGRGGTTGIATDIYALGATLYFALTGEVPPSALERLNEPLRPPSELQPHLSRALDDAVLAALALPLEDRPRSLDEWLPRLRVTPQGPDSQYAIKFDAAKNDATAKNDAASQYAIKFGGSAAKPPPKPSAPAGATVGTSAPGAKVKGTSKGPRRIKVSGATLLWPRLCACCGTHLGDKAGTRRHASGWPCLEAALSDFKSDWDQLLCGWCLRHTTLAAQADRLAREAEGAARKGDADMTLAQRQAQESLFIAKARMEQSRRNAAAAAGQMDVAARPRPPHKGVAAGWGFMSFCFFAFVTPFGLSLMMAALTMMVVTAMLNSNESKARGARLAQAQSAIQSAHDEVSLAEAQAASAEQIHAELMRSTQRQIRQRVSMLEEEARRTQNAMRVALQSACCSSRHAVALVNSHHSERTFEFHNGEFADAFEMVNSDKVLRS